MSLFVTFHTELEKNIRSEHRIKNLINVNLNSLVKYFEQNSILRRGCRKFGYRIFLGSGSEAPGKFLDHALFLSGHALFPQGNTHPHKDTP